MAANFPKDVEKCADFLDQAAQNEETLKQFTVLAASAAVAPENHHRFDGLHCVEDDCGVAIPAERLTMGRVRCVDCQAERERQKTLRGRF